MKKALRAILLILLSFAASQASAANLTEVFKQAMASDPTIKNARALVEVAQAGVPIARSTLLPSLDITGSLTQERRYVLKNKGGFDNTAAQYSLTLTQPIFNYAGWMAVKNANALVKQAVASFYATVQQVMFDTANAYFTVLQNYEILRFTTAEKKALARQLEQNEERFKVGLVAITDVYEVRAQYDLVRAREIAAENNIANALENLREITGQTYRFLMGATRSYPLVRPQPADINQWVNTALQQNYSVQAARYLLLSDRANIKQQAAGRYPVISAVGGLSGQRETQLTPAGPISGTGRVFTNFASGGVSLSFPAYQGGLIGANTRQAREQLNANSSALEKTMRSVANQTRQSYLNVITGIGKIKADKQSVLSSRKALEASEAAFSVGQRTIVDVLLSQSALYQAEQTFAQDQYTYILDGLKLKQLAGTLSFDDFQRIDQRLTQRISVARFTRRAQGNRYHPPVHAQKTLKKAKKPGAISKKSTTTKQPQSTGRYTLQWIATPNQRSAQRFIHQHPGLKQARVIKKQVGDKVQYAVVSGHYQRYAQAKAALAKLPPRLAALKPWIYALKQS